MGERECTFQLRFCICMSISAIRQILENESSLAAQRVKGLVFFYHSSLDRCRDVGLIPGLAQGVQGSGVAAAAVEVTAVAWVHSLAWELP